jgi:hypothetical protein
MSDQKSAIPNPEGYDEAIYKQGLKAGEAALAAGTDPAAAPDNPFEAAHQAESWAAGYAAGNPTIPIVRSSSRKASDAE